MMPINPNINKIELMDEPSFSAASDKQNGQTKLAWLYTKSVFITKAVTASDIAIKHPNKPHPVAHLSGFWTSLLFCLEPNHPTAIIHSRMNSVGMPK
jgi:hypothetical protein